MKLTSTTSIKNETSVYRRTCKHGSVNYHLSKSEAEAAINKTDRKMGCCEIIQFVNVSVLNELVKAIERVHSDPAYVGVWQVSQLHVGPYNGPSYVDELNRLKEILE